VLEDSKGFGMGRLHNPMARQRYRDYLATVFDTHGFTDSGTPADDALDALAPRPGG
jgi:hypothetical protein